MNKPATDPIIPKIDPTDGKKIVTESGTRRRLAVTLLKQSEKGGYIWKTIDLKKLFTKGKQQKRKQNRANLIKNATISVGPNIQMQFY